MIMFCRRWRHLLLWGMALLAISACGGGGGSDTAFAPPSGTGPVISGFIEDGPIADARVQLVDPATGEALELCWASGRGRCETRSDDRGYFRLVLAEGLDPAGFLLQAEGGLDLETGLSLTETGLVLQAPVAAFGSLRQAVLSPVTTLVTRRAEQTGLNGALSETAAWLSLPAGGLFERSSSSLALQRVNLLLASVALALQRQGVADAWVDIADQFTNYPVLLDGNGSIDSALLSTGLGLSTGDVQRLTSLADNLAAAADATQAFTLANRAMLEAVLAPEIDEYLLARDGAFDISDANYLANRAYLFDRMQDQGFPVPLNDWIPQRLLQHFLLGYGLNDPARWLDPPANFAAALVRTDSTGSYTPADDPVIAAVLAGQQRVQAHLPLLADQLLPAGDNLARVRYYYASDLSHLDRADRLARTVLDDELNDALLIDLVEGIARAGIVRGWVPDDLLPYDPVLMIHSRMANPVNQALALIELGKGAGRWGRTADALTALAEAERLLRDALAVKGTAFFNDTDAANFRELARGYLAAGDLSSAIAVLQYLYQDIAVPVATYQAYANAFSAGMPIADDLLAQGDTVTALQVIDLMRQIAINTPAETSAGSPISYINRVFHMVETARRYALAGSSPDALDLYYGPGMVEALRLNDGLANKTGTRTKVYMDDMAVALFLAGDKAGALGLLDTLASLSRSWGYKQLAAEVAVMEAESGGLQPQHASEPAAADLNALDLVFFKVPTDLFNLTVEETQVEALTYYVSNRSKAYVGLRLIEENQDTAALTALQLATDLARTIDPNLAKNILGGSARVEYGLAKIADLYVDLGRETEARSLLVEAEQDVGLMTDASMATRSLAALADVWLRLGDGDQAAALLGQTGGSLSLDAYNVLLDALLRTGASGAAGQLDAYAQLALSLFQPGVTSDSDLFEIAKHLRFAAGYAHDLGDQSLAVDLLNQARDVVLDIADPQDRLDKMVEWAAAWADIDEFDKVLDAARLAEEHFSTAGRNQALQTIGKVYALRDDLAARDVAVSDLDGDGRPDFFHPLLSQADMDASGLVLDDDMDGDGVPDAQDARPMFFDTGL